MSLSSILRAVLGWWREAAPAPIAPPPARGGVTVAAVGDPPPAPAVAPGRALVVPELLAELGAASPATWAPILSAACETAEVSNRRRLAPFLGNVLHETRGLKRLRESLDYSPERLAAVWPSRFALADTKPPRPNRTALRVGRYETGGQVIPARQEEIAELAYGGRLGNYAPGDAWRFRGAGLLQLTGRENWQRAADALGITMEELEARIASPEEAAATAALFWRWRGCNELADAGDLAALRRRINGGTIGLEAVEGITVHARSAIARHAPWVPS